MKFSVIIPVFNEAENIREILRRVQATKLAAEIIVVDDGSSDGTREALKKLNGSNRVRVILYGGNHGKGASCSHTIWILGNYSRQAVANSRASSSFA